MSAYLLPMLANRRVYAKEEKTHVQFLTPSHYNTSGTEYPCVLEWCGISYHLYTGYFQEMRKYIKLFSSKCHSGLLLTQKCGKCPNALFSAWTNSITSFFAYFPMMNSFLQLNVIPNTITIAWRLPYIFCFPKMSYAKIWRVLYHALWIPLKIVIKVGWNGPIRIILRIALYLSATQF